MGRTDPSPLYSPGLAVAFLRGGTAPATVMSDQCSRQTKAGYQGERGSLLLDWVSVGIVSAHLHRSIQDWNKNKYFDV